MELHIKAAGFLLTFLALLHVIFPRYFNWKSDLKNVSSINRQMMYIHAFFIAFGVFLMALLCLTSAHELVSTPLGKRVALGFGIFWFTRLCIQFFGYSSLLWKGKTFETTVHILFAGLWTYLSAVFFAVYFL